MAEISKATSVPAVAVAPTTAKPTMVSAASAGVGMVRAIALAVSAAAASALGAVKAMSKIS